MLEENLESPLDCKQIPPVCPESKTSSLPRWSTPAWASPAWASLAQRFPASSVLAWEGAGCGSVADVPGAWLASAPLSPSLCEPSTLWCLAGPFPGKREERVSFYLPFLTQSALDPVSKHMPASGAVSLTPSPDLLPGQSASTVSLPFYLVASSQ